MTSVISMLRNDSLEAPIFAGSESLKLVPQSGETNVVVLSSMGSQHVEPSPAQAPAASVAVQDTGATAPTPQALQTPLHAPAAEVVASVAETIAAQAIAAPIASDQVPISAQVQTKVEAAPPADAPPVHAPQMPVANAVNQHISPGTRLSDFPQEYQSTPKTVQANITMPPNRPQVTRTTTAVSTQRSGRQVAIKEAELDQYFRGKRPTGLLFKSVATLKGMSTATIASGCGIPEAVVKSIFTGSTAGVKYPLIEKLSQMLGINLSSMSLALGQVHIFHLANLSLFAGKEANQKVLRGVGILARNARVAEVLAVSTIGHKTYVAQSENFRAIFISSPIYRFDLGLIPFSAWARGKAETSQVRTISEEIRGRLKKFDITEHEFDEIFIGPNAISWKEVTLASRSSGISKAELMDFIRGRVAHQETVEKRQLLNPIELQSLFSIDMFKPSQARISAPKNN